MGKYTSDSINNYDEIQGFKSLRVEHTDRLGRCKFELQAENPFLNCFFFLFFSNSKYYFSNLYIS